MVNAWTTANPISLGQVVGNETGNEIAAVPKLLEIPEVSGCIVVIDAMDCQTRLPPRLRMATQVVVWWSRATGLLHVKVSRFTL